MSPSGMYGYMPQGYGYPGQQYYGSYGTYGYNTGSTSPYSQPSYYPSSYYASPAAAGAGVGAPTSAGYPPTATGVTSSRGAYGAMTANPSQVAIMNLPPAFSGVDLGKLLQHFGGVVNVHITSDPTSKGPSSGMVIFDTVSSAQIAKRHLDGSEVGGYRLSIKVKEMGRSDGGKSGTGGSL